MLWLAGIVYFVGCVLPFEAVFIGIDPTDTLTIKKCSFGLNA